VRFEGFGNSCRQKKIYSMYYSFGDNFRIYSPSVTIINSAPLSSIIGSEVLSENRYYRLDGRHKDTV
jgi:hypothetical protein